MYPSTSFASVFTMKNVIIVMIVRVPDNPSTPSEQFVTLIEAHTSITVRTANSTGGM